MSILLRTDGASSVPQALIGSEGHSARPWHSVSASWLRRGLQVAREKQVEQARKQRLGDAKKQ